MVDFVDLVEERLGGSVSNRITECDILVTHMTDMNKNAGKVKTANNNEIPLVTEEWLKKCLKDKIKCKAIIAKAQAGEGKPQKQARAKAKASDSSSPTKKRKQEDDLDVKLSPKVKKVKEESATPKAKAKSKAPIKKEESEDDSNEEEEDKKPKTVTRIVKGAAPVDIKCPQKDKYHVYKDASGVVWDAMLNQTNVRDNNNKFYLLQLLKADDGPGCLVWYRWGRVGYDGQSTSVPFQNLSNAQNEFSSKFAAKTNYSWPLDMKDYVPIKGKYTLLQMDYGEDEIDKEAGDSTPKEVKKEAPSKLHTKIQKLMELIFDLNMMKMRMAEIGYDAEKMPLGKISKEMIKQGYEALKEIETELQKKSPKKSTLLELSSDFYTVVPHDFGFKRMAEFKIDTLAKLKDKLDMVSSLADIGLAAKIIKNETPDDNENRIDKHYKQLNCKLEPMEESNNMFKIINEYTTNTHGRTHTAWKVKVKNVFQLDREDETERYKKFENNENRMLLWHGSRLTNYVGILSQASIYCTHCLPVSGFTNSSTRSTSIRIYVW
eukprot:GHVL01023971.1.p1 GENE.GHVL01023971.1~~GHVL01023971.1.p1  ORF type:complete len:547 (+),score=90.13 GHVL01023971.1:3-1643(+)